MFSHRLTACAISLFSISCLASSEPEEKKDEAAMSAELQSDYQMAHEIDQDIFSASIKKGEFEFSKALFKCGKIKDSLMREEMQEQAFMWMLPALERAAQSQHAKIEKLERSVQELKKKLEDKENERYCIVQ